MADVVAIYKKGDRNTPANYRPVSLTSITCKTLEHIVFGSIMEHLDHHGILNHFQHGFRFEYRLGVDRPLLSSIMLEIL